MTSKWQSQKRAVAQTARRMAEMGLATGASGNVSVRLPPYETTGLLAITPSGRRYSELSDNDVVVVGFDVEPVEGELAPSSESLMHVAAYRARPDVGAMIHTHGVYSTVAAVAGLEIPPIIDEMVVAIGGAIRVSEYAFPGTKELADNVCSALGERNAALIRSHGAVGVGTDLDEALDVCALTERVAQVFVLSSLLGKVGTLPPEVVKAEQAIFRMRRGSQPTARA